MSVLQVGALFDHPIKSCAARNVATLDLDERGPVHDRRWMLVDPDGRFVTQRELPELAAIRAEPTPSGGLLVDAPGSARLEVAAPIADAPVTVEVWGDSCEAADAGEDAASWFSSLAGRTLRLVRQAPRDPRRTPGSYADAPVAFADGFPLLLLGQGSIDAIADATGAAVDPRRFRPNVVVAGTGPFEEDRWRRVRVGALELDVVKPCTRCVMIDIDPDTGRADRGLLRALAPWRVRGGRVLVAQNAVHRAPGTIRVGDPIEVLEAADE